MQKLEFIIKLIKGNFILKLIFFFFKKKKKKRCAISNSTVCPGFGLFNLEPLAKGDFIIKYSGEVLTNE